MFSFGIFTTHLPYVAFVVFYAYFLIFGLEKSHDGEIQVSEHSVHIQYHVNDFQPTAVLTYHFQQQQYYAEIEHIRLCCKSALQKWKWFNTQCFTIQQDYVQELPFCRPPPSFA